MLVIHLYTSIGDPVKDLGGAVSSFISMEVEFDWATTTAHRFGSANWSHMGVVPGGAMSDAEWMYRA